MNGALWYTERSAGVVTYLLLSTSVVVGMALSRRGALAWPKFAVEELHRFLTILTACFLTLHVAAILLDTVVPFSLVDVLVPFAAGYRPFATGLGVVALELLVAVAVTNALRKRLPYRLWRRAHYATLGVWVLATVHGVLAGTDRGELWFLGLYAASVTAVAMVASVRFLPAQAT